MANSLKKRKISYREMPGDAVFYGPKIDINIVDASNREWQCSTIQFDFNMPKRFNITYIGADGQEHEVLMIHRALLGAIERFFAILIENYEGNLPDWLASTQVKILSVNDNCTSYAHTVLRKLQAHGIRCDVDTSASTISHKIREAELQKFPYMLICGEREVKAKKISVRRHKTGNIGQLTIQEFLREIRKECNW